MAEQILVIRLTETQMKALDAFLGRVNLNAKEVNAFTDVINALTKATAAPNNEAYSTDELPVEEK